MKKTTLFLAIIVLLAGVSVQAQKSSRLKPINPPVPRLLSVEDQTGGGYITFDMITGDFKCNMCEYKLALNGTGDVKVDGFNVYLSSVTDGYHIFITVNMWDRTGKAVMEVFNNQTDLPPIQEFWTDLSIDDNSLKCVKIQPAQ